MDAETKKIFDDLLSETSRRSKPSMYREKSRPVHEYEKRTKESYSFTHARKEYVPEPIVEEEFNTLEHIAVLSVNQAKACIVFRAPTNTQVRNEITRLAGPSQAKYNKQDGVWELHPAILVGIKSVLKTHYKDVHVLGVQKQIQATKFDQLMSRLTKDDKDKIYKLLALKYHPDKGGDKETMILVNAVFKGGV